MGCVKNESYLHIEGWMVNELNLKGNDLMVYAIIYGFSQDGQSTFSGGLSYLADWCGATKQGIQKNLKNLIDLGLIIKHEVFRNNVKFCEYSCTPCNSVVHPMQLSCTNTISNTIGSNIISKDIISNNKKDEASSKLYSDDFSMKPKRNKKKSLYDQCVDEIYLYTQSMVLAQLLIDYLKLRLAMKDKPIYGVNQWKALLDKLDKIHEDNVAVSYEDIVSQSIERGYASFFPVNAYKKKDKLAEGNGLSCEQEQTTSEDRRNRLRDSGRRSEF